MVEDEAAPERSVRSASRYMNPETTAMHIPLVLDEVNIFEPRLFSPDIDSLAP